MMLMQDYIKTKKNYFESKGENCVEIHVTKRDGCKFHLIMEQEAFKKLPQKKLKMLKNIMG